MAHFHTGPGVGKDVVVRPKLATASQHFLAVKTIRYVIGDDAPKICYKHWAQGAGQDPGDREVLWEVEGSSDVLG